VPAGTRSATGAGNSRRETISGSQSGNGFTGGTAGTDTGSIGCLDPESTQQSEAQHEAAPDTAFETQQTDATPSVPHGEIDTPDTDAHPGSKSTHIPRRAAIQRWNRCFIDSI
jgi:hypothetical protein